MHKVILKEKSKENFMKELIDKKEQIERGERIRRIRIEELGMNKSQLGRAIGVKGQFIKLVEDGKGNFVYPSIKKLCLLSGHSADYILFGLDDNKINTTREMLEEFSHEEIIHCMETIKSLIGMLKLKNDLCINNAFSYN